MEKAHIDMAYLAACAVNNHKPDMEYVRTIELGKVYANARKHNLTAVTYYGLQMSEILEDSLTDEEKNYLAKWKADMGKAIRKNMLLDAERSKFLAFCEKEGIWNMPLKGSILKDIYPKPGMRQMADNDILFDQSFRKKVRAYFVSQGFKVEEYDTGVHDIYQKEPIYNFEMHTVLFGEGHKKEFTDYYADVKSRLIKDDNKAYSYHFTVEDFYVYFIAHAYKHFAYYGTGLRTLLDIYIYQKNYGTTWDREYIVSELKKLNIFEYEELSGKLATKVFSDNKPVELADYSEEEQKVLDSYMTVGTYGNINNMLEQEMRKIQDKGEKISAFTKIRYLYRRIIPTKEFMLVWAGNRFAPFFRKYPFLLPFLVVYRWFAGGIGNLKHNLFEMDAVKRK